jgi:hypothetical protein
MIAVGWTGIYYEWTPNNVALGIVMVGAAWFATKAVLGMAWLWRIFREWRAHRKTQKWPYVSQIDGG